MHHKSCSHKAASKNRVCQPAQENQFAAPKRWGRHATFPLMGTGGLSGLAALSLTATAVAPVCAVWLCTYTPDWGWRAPAYAAALTLVLLLACYSLLNLSARKLQKEPFSVASADHSDGQLVGLLVAYAMPLLAGPPKQMLAPLVAFVFFLVLLLWKTQLVNVNPLASFLGYHFYQVKSESGMRYTLLSKDPQPPRGTIQTVRLSRILFLEIAKTAEESH